MKLHLVACLLIVGLFSVKVRAEEEAGEKPEITKLELVDLGEGESDVDAKDWEVHRKRNSGYSFKRPGGFAQAPRARFQAGPPGHRGRIVNRHPAQISRPINKYGPPGYQNSPPTRPASHSQQHRDKLQFHGHFGQQRPSNFDGRPSGLLEQEVPSPIRQAGFIEPNPISSQNNEPFASHGANYLPPQNQKLPGYTAPQTFSASHVSHNLQDNNQGQSANFQSQNIVQSQGHISDAALFLEQNAQAIQQLYGAAATDQDFAPNDGQFLGQNDQVQQFDGQLENFESSSRSPQAFAGALPSYASGILGNQETLEQIQSLEKDRLIAQLQRALATQAQGQNADAAGRYAQNQPSFVQSQDLLASIGQRMKIHGFNTQPSILHFGPGSTAFNQSPFLPGTTISPGFPLNYGPLTTAQPTTITFRPSTTTTQPTTITFRPSTTTAQPTTVTFRPSTTTTQPTTITFRPSTTQPSTTTTQPSTTTTTTTVQPSQDAKGDRTLLAGSIVPTNPTSPPRVGVPVYGGFVPTLITGTSFLSNVPSYGPTFLAPGTVASVQPSGSSPTHFGLPIPTDHTLKPTLGSTPSSTPSSAPTTPSASRPSAPSSPPFSAVPLHPISTPLHPVVTPLHPVSPFQPALPPTHVHPVQTPPTGHPTYGLQPSVINSFLYKPVKPVYPLYYYPNVAYQLQKPASLPTYPWNYAPTYPPIYAQTKPAQIWK